MDHDKDTLIALATTAAQRWPLINALPGEERARIVESLRDLRVRLHSARVTSADIPGKALTGQTEIPGNPRDTATLAGTLHRGEFRGVRVQATAKHAETCLWSRELWPLTPTGEIVPCTCGLTERLDGPIASQVKGELWVKWLALWQEEANILRKSLNIGNRAERRAKAKALIAAYGPPKPTPEPTPETWETLRDRILASVADVALLRATL